MNVKVWVVAHTKDSETLDVNVFDSKADAGNYAEEMNAQKNGVYKVMESVLNSRADTDASHLVELPDFDTECIECLVDGYEVDQDKFDADKAAAFLKDHQEEIKQKADTMVQDYIKQELHDYLLGERVILG